VNANYIAAPFIPWWDEGETGPAPSCGVCGAMMVHRWTSREGRYWTHHRSNIGQRPEWACMSCGNRIPAHPGGQEVQK